jgi:hypothetical protein
MTAVDVAVGTLHRLSASANRLAALDEQRAAEVDLRDELVCQARDEGSHWSRIAAAARLSPARCSAIVTGA